MTAHKYETILKKARECKKNVEKNQKLGINSKWGYFFAKAILTPHKTIKSFDFKEAPNPNGHHISNQISKKDYLDCCKRIVAFVEKHKKMPNFVIWKSKNLKIRERTYIYNLAKILVWYADHKNTLPAMNNINTKIWVKPKEYPEEIYDYFVKRLGKFNNTIDGALELIDGNGYAGYSDDYYSNKTSIDRMADYDGINCTDSCHVFYNILKHLIKLGKYKKVQCIHVGCRYSGTGHVRLRIQLNDGDWIYRDPASVLDGNGITSNWCMDGEYWATDPSWFMENLNR